ncbi:MAG: hypothetical protein WCA10_06975 [Terracidiphilus sp.]
MPNDNVPAEITVSSTYFPSQNPTTATKSHGVKFIPPTDGCTICADKDIGGKKRHDINKPTTFSLETFTVGDTITYDLFAYGTPCTQGKRKDSIGNSIIVGSGMPK